MPGSASAPADVSVVIIVKNGARFIARALDSISASSVRPAEILVLDGGSSDGTLDIVRARSNVTLATQTSRGIADAYNEAIALTRSGLIAFLSHDDLWTPEKLERHLELMEREPQLLYTVSLVQHFLEPGSAPPPGFRRELLERPVPGMLMEALVARRTAFEIVGAFDPRLSIGNDTDWFARAIDAGTPYAVIPEVLVHKRVHSTNASLNEAQISNQLLTALRDSVARKRADRR